ncbi:hypothetical protein HJC10_27770, partial [Corallococcus exiguus]|nr:hypothetical protein [Corallococcus exiguus]
FGEQHMGGYQAQGPGPVDTESLVSAIRERVGEDLRERMANMVRDRVAEAVRKELKNGPGTQPLAS